MLSYVVMYHVGKLLAAYSLPQIRFCMGKLGSKQLMRGICNKVEESIKICRAYCTAAEKGGCPSASLQAHT